MSDRSSGSGERPDSGQKAAEQTTLRLESHEADRAAAILAEGGTVGLPTETVYGLGADAADDDAVAKIFEAKGRPAGHPLIVHLASVDQLPDWTTSTDPRVGLLADAFWPGPLTLILPRTDRVSRLVVGGRDSVGVRVPDHPVAQAVLSSFAELGSGGVAAPSANRFGHVSPTSGDHVLADLEGRIDAVIDGGRSRVGVESTIVELVGEEVVLLRPGGVSVEALERVLGEPVVDGRSGESRAAGMLASHYAPNAPVRLVSADDLAAGAPVPDSVGLIGPTDAPALHRWPLPVESDAFAEGLYAVLRAADDRGVEEIWIIPPSTGPLLDAVLDRLAKASVPRSSPPPTA